MKQTVYRIDGKAFGRHMRLALVADLHAGRPQGVIEAIKLAAPDYILLAGDILERLDGSHDSLNEQAFCIFSECAAIAPTFYCTGNHEDGGVHSGRGSWRLTPKDRVYTKENTERIKASGVHFLVNELVLKDGIAFGGLASGIICKDAAPDTDFIERFARVEAPKILICHHPEYYGKYLKDKDIDIVVSGHAHGGQWRIFGRGVYAPGQGLFPKYTSGVHDGRLVISRGLKKGRVPRFFNSREIVIIDL